MKYTKRIRTPKVTTKEGSGEDNNTNNPHTDTHEDTNFEEEEASIEVPAEDATETRGGIDHGHPRTQRVEKKIEITDLDHDHQGIGHPQQSALIAQGILTGNYSAHTLLEQRKIGS